MVIIRFTEHAIVVSSIDRHPNFTGFTGDRLTLMHCRLHKSIPCQSIGKIEKRDNNWMFIGEDTCQSAREVVDTLNANLCQNHNDALRCWSNHLLSRCGV